MLRLLCENADKGGFSVNLTSIFTFIGMAFCIVVALVALVWLTCFVVRLLIKTFKTSVQNSYDIFVENSTEKTKSKKERNTIKRQAKDARKMEILNLKQESQDRIHKMKVEKLEKKLMETEERAKEKLGVSSAQPKEKTISEKIKRQAELDKLRGIEEESVSRDEEVETQKEIEKSKKETKEEQNEIKTSKKESKEEK